ncbi:MAG: hypothetical protein VB862_06675 [Pirellulaceae bacterium]
MIQQPPHHNHSRQRHERRIDPFLQGAATGIVAGGCSGIIACCVTNAVAGALLAYTSWNQFAHPLGAMLTSALYLGCLALPIGLVVAVPSGLVMGGFIGYCQASGRRTWPVALVCMAILFGLLEGANGLSQRAQAPFALLPGQWQQHLATLAGVALGLVHWSRKRPVRWHRSRH